MTRRWIPFVVWALGLVGVLAGATVVAQPLAEKSISLAGIWHFKLDPFVTGISSNGVQLLPGLPEEITLPGSTDQAGKGYRTEGMTSLRLTRLFEYKGVAWYEKEVFIPETWKGKEIRLFLERAHWETTVWINDHPAGKRESLSVPHVYDLTAWVRPGKKNSIRIRVDNNMIYNIEYSHAASAETQTNWNGIIGKMELQAFDKVHIGEIQVFPHLASHTAEFHITVANTAKKMVKGSLKFQAVSVPFSGGDSLIEVTGFLPLAKKMATWDEFNPTLYHIKIGLEAEEDGITEQDGIKYQDTRTVTFGMREIATEGTRFTINGRPTFIRGTVNSAEFPLTGYPDMDQDQWAHIFAICKEYGLNAMRFHSWCPPEAAFAAADQAGIYLQVENSDWRFTIGKDSAVDQFLQEEAKRILRTYGNHPSFTMFCEGNELVGPSVGSFLSALLADWKKDPRHLYTGSSGYPVVPGNQYNDFYGPRPQHWKEGLKGRFNAEALNTVYDYADYVKKFTIPLVSHEIGQWCVYPDFDQIPKYSGVLRPFNYELFRESLRAHHLSDLAKEFTLASGRFQVIQKKEEIESYLRTPGLGGYHLLQLNDFPGQGTAPVGVVDDFWDPKFYTTGKEFRQFQSAVVLLLRTNSFTWTNDETFTARIELANFGSGPLQKGIVKWTLRFPDGKLYAEGRTSRSDLPVGSPIPLGNIHVALDGIRQASALTLRMEIAGTDCSNQWEIWVYPRSLPAIDGGIGATRINTVRTRTGTGSTRSGTNSTHSGTNSTRTGASPTGAGIRIAYEWNDSVKEELRQGAKVLLLADTAKINSDAGPAFSGISWNTVWSGMPPNMLGILCDPQNPALKDFPTEFHSNWQWWDLVRHSKPMNLDHTPASFRPLVEMIPDWNTNKKIGLVWEARVGKGSLLVSAIDLRDAMPQRPVAAQLLYSLEKYAASADFAPVERLSEGCIDELFKK